MTSHQTDELPRSWLTGLGARPPRHPQVTVELGRCVPAWVLRLVCAVAAACCALLVASHPGHGVVAVGIIAFLLANPSGSAPGILAVGAGLLVLTSGAEVFDARVFPLMLALHLTLELAAVIGDLPWAAPVELRILAGAARPFLAIQALAQSVALGGAWTSSRELSMVGVPALAGIALAVLAWSVLARVRPDG